MRKTVDRQSTACAADLQRRPLIKYTVTILATAGIVALTLTLLFWQKSARAVVRDLREMISGSRPRLELKSRPDKERFAFDRSILEFSRTPPVDQAVIDPESPDYSVRRGLEVAVHSGGYTYPVNIAFSKAPDSDPESPFYYVAELHGSIKYATRRGDMRTIIEGLLEFPPADLNISDEFGLSGLALVPGTRDLIVTHPVPDKKTGLYLNAITRLHLEDGGRRCARREIVKVLAGEPTCPSNQIQQAAFGTDGKLYVSIGDAMNYSLSRNKERWGGKILRMNADGSACGDNPFYDGARAGSPASYAFTIGLRNAFDFVFDRGAAGIWAGDVGEDLNRLLAVRRGADHGWDGTPDSFCRNAAYLFQDGFVPAGMTFVDAATVGSEFNGCLWIAGYSYFFGPGPGASKRIVSFEVKGGALTSGPVGVLAYKGEGQSTILGLEQGPDGVYFTDFFGEQTTGEARGKGKVMRISRSRRTSSLPINLKPVEWESWNKVQRGKYVFVKTAGCGACHTIERLAEGREGPDLTHLVPRLSARLGSTEYRREVEALARDAAGAETEPQITAVLQARGEEQLRLWLRSHLRNPRFDNPRGKMPQFSLLAGDEVEYLIDFLLSLD